ncbi:MAG: rhomboid family intramembrane serine protease [Microvirga sp.]|jgi:membrane associated rhomboid family serine protease|nr:rhomboid family intramembrane serine protease [Beijerinckiaceae bacterium]
MQVQPAEPRREPIFNMPGIVTAAVVILVAIHALRAALLSAGADLELLLDFAVVPARWTAAFDPSRLEAILREAGAGFSPQEAGLREALARYVVGDGAKPWTALTYAVLHGSWAHVLLNAVWLAAFGTPVARRCGAWRFLLLGAACAVAGAAAHVVTDPLSVAPMVGASAAISGWMAAAARFVFAPASPGSRRVGEAHERPRQNIVELLRNRGAAVFLLVWFASNLLFGLAAAPLGITDASVAWEAHIGGFVVGLLLFPWLDRR